MKIHSKSRASLLNSSAGKQQAPANQNSKISERALENPERDEISEFHHGAEATVNDQTQNDSNRRNSDIKPLGTSTQEYFSFSPLENKKSSIYDSAKEKAERYFYLENGNFDSFSFSNEKPDYRNLETFGSVGKNEGYGSRDSSPEELPPAV